MPLFSKRNKYQGKNVLITGGSSGIGKSMAIQLAEQGANVIISSRSKAKLDEAIQEISASAKHPEKQRFHAIACDVTNFDAVNDMVTQTVQFITANASENGSRQLDLVISCAGQATPGYFLETERAQFARDMDLNYFGGVNVAKATVPHLLREGRRGQAGTIVFVASTLALMGCVGYSSYCPSKWALRGLADSLRTEFAPYGLTVCVAYPPDTDTPGYKSENETKPPDTAEISKAGSLWTSSQVAAAMLKGVSECQYHITCDFGTYLLSVLMPGLNPRNRPVWELLIVPVVAIIGCVITLVHDGIVGKWAPKRRVMPLVTAEGTKKKNATK